LLDAPHEPDFNFTRPLFPHIRVLSLNQLLNNRFENEASLPESLEIAVNNLHNLNEVLILVVRNASAPERRHMHLGVVALSNRQVANATRRRE
jgi:hypothetical protein